MCNYIYKCYSPVHKCKVGKEYYIYFSSKGGRDIPLHKHGQCHLLSLMCSSTLAKLKINDFFLIKQSVDDSRT